MSKKSNRISLILCLEITLLICACNLSFLLHCSCFPFEAVLLNARPTAVKQFHLPDNPRYDIGYFSSNFRFKPSEPILSRRPAITVEKYFQIEPSDAISNAKYSQPAVDYHQLNSYPGMQVPSKTLFQDKPVSIPNSSPVFSKEESPPSYGASNDSSKPLRDLRFLDSTSNKDSQDTKTSLKQEYKIPEDNLNSSQSDLHLNEDSSNYKSQTKNFTDSDTNLLPVSSDVVLSYESPSGTMDTDASKYIIPVKKSAERAIEDLPSHYSDSPKLTYSDSPKLTYSDSPISTLLSTHLYTDFVNQTESTEKTTTLVLPSIYDVENTSTISPSFENNTGKLSSGTVAGIVIGVLVCVTILSSTVIYLLYRRYNGKCASVVEGKFNSDNCGYLDDSLRSSIYLNNHIELPKESSEEMSSLDNDSFLNSLETMTIQNYWADNSKNTKV